MMRVNLRLMLMGVVAIAMATTAKAESFFFSTGDPDGKIATATRPASAGLSEIESADDFVLTQETKINSASFTGLVTGPSPPSIGNVVVEIYHVFPTDSNVGRTSGPPTFSTDRVPTRVNSPSDVALDSRDSASSTLTSTTSSLTSFTASNSVQPGGIHPKPNQTTGGDGPVTGQEIRFNTSFTNPFDLQAGHYFFVPQVEVMGGNFLWLSAPKPIVSPGTPFPPGNTDLQSWTRDDPGLAPDWLRVGTDIVGGSPAPTFNASFSLSGTVVPEPSSLLMGGTAALLGLGYAWRRRRRATA